MNKTATVAPLLMALSLLTAPVVRAQNQQDSDSSRANPQFEELPSVAPTEAAPSAAPTSPEAQPAASEASPAVSAPAVTEPAAPPMTAPRAAAAPRSKPYKVRIWQTDGECLWRIAEKVYGDRSKWKLIYEANKDVIRDPNKIYPKQRLKIPPSDWQP